MEITELGLKGVLELRPKYYLDGRGFFAETFRLNLLEEAVGEKIKFVQNNHSHSKKGTLRGIHAEKWDKLIYVPRGEIFIALVDLRPDSPTFKQYITHVIGDSNQALVYIPNGLGNSMQVLSDKADYFYQVTAYYDGSDVRAIAWDDPELNIPWPIKKPFLSERDKNNPTLSALFS